MTAFSIIDVDIYEYTTHALEYYKNICITRKLTILPAIGIHFYKQHRILI